METNETKKTCDQQIDAKLKARLEDLLPDVESWSVIRCARYLKGAGRSISTTDPVQLQSEVREIIREQACDDLLSIERIRSYKLCLSYGGPADYFELDWDDASCEWVGGRYLFQDWFDGASQNISAELAEQLADLYGILPEDE